MNSLRFFSETGAGKHVPRCVMVDLDPGTEIPWIHAFFLQKVEVW